MKIWRVMGIGVLFWIIIFVEISITMIGLKFSNLITYIVHYIVMVPLAAFCAWLYYKSKDKVNGFLLGLLIAAVGIVLDLIITVPLFVIPAGGNYATYFSEIYLIAGLIESILVVWIYDLMRKRL